MTDNPGDVDVEVEGYDGEINWEESSRNDPKARTLGSPVYCFEPGSGAILSAGGQPNSNTNCGGQHSPENSEPTADAAAQTEEGEEPEPEA
ncbi:hypothetical protein [Natronobeatus ordinarius]|uniref:hypothetical protein n=1 Tax=Natronobeatus ordinarius TaxID=2963433 RepID=UPI0020CC84CA|nr:hypothetical protein [Natronobeatus ordinarius]